MLLTWGARPPPRLLTAVANRGAQPALQNPQRKLKKSGAIVKSVTGGRALTHAAGHTGPRRGEEHSPIAHLFVQHADVRQCDADHRIAGSFAAATKKAPRRSAGPSYTRAVLGPRRIAANVATGGEASWCRMSTSSACVGEPRSLKASIGLVSVKRLSRVSRRMR